MSEPIPDVFILAGLEAERMQTIKEGSKDLMTTEKRLKRLQSNAELIP